MNNYIYNFMKHHHCLLLSLFDRPLILKTSDEYDKISFKNKGLPSLFCEYNHDGFVIVEGEIQIIKFDELDLDPSMVSKFNHDHENLSFSKLSHGHKDLGEYQLEKGSIIWKIKTEEFEKSKINTEKSMGKITKRKIENLVKYFIKKLKTKQGHGNIRRV